MDTNKYIPGVCNIGKEETKKRKQIGVTGLILTILVYYLFVHFEVSKGIRFLIFIPVLVSAIGFLQARMHFCVYFGLAETFNFDLLGKFTRVENDEFVKMDKKKARLIIFYSILIGIVVGILAVLI